MCDSSEEPPRRGLEAACLVGCASCLGRDFVSVKPANQTCAFCNNVDRTPRKTDDAFLASLLQRWIFARTESSVACVVSIESSSVMSTIEGRRNSSDKTTWADFEVNKCKLQKRRSVLCLEAFFLTFSCCSSLF